MAPKLLLSGSGPALENEKRNPQNLQNNQPLTVTLASWASSILSENEHMAGDVFPVLEWPQLGFKSSS